MRRTVTELNGVNGGMSAEVNGVNGGRHVMLRVFVWMLLGMFVAHLALVIVVLLWAPPPHHFIYSASSVWFLLSAGALVVGAILGTLFGVADTVLRSVTGLLAEIRTKLLSSNIQQSGSAGETKVSNSGSFDGANKE